MLVLDCQEKSLHQHFVCNVLRGKKKSAAALAEVPETTVRLCRVRSETGRHFRITHCYLEFKWSRLPRQNVNKQQ